MAEDISGKVNMLLKEMSEHSSQVSYLEESAYPISLPDVLAAAVECSQECLNTNPDEDPLYLLGLVQTDLSDALGYILDVRHEYSFDPDQSQHIDSYVACARQILQIAEAAIADNAMNSGNVLSGSSIPFSGEDVPIPFSPEEIDFMAGAAAEFYSSPDAKWE